MDRIEEFKRDGKNFVYINFSGLRTKDEFIHFIESAKPIIKKYPQNSIYTITNVEGVNVTSEINVVMSKWTEHNKPYVKYGAVYGLDNVKKTVAKAIGVMSRRTNLNYLATKEECISWLLKQD